MPTIDLGNIVGPAGQDGLPGKDATINGVNTLEIIEGDNITLEQTGSILKISATGGGPVTREVVINAPIGAILPWSGGEDTIPTGWHICDGTNGTVDLRDRFILGAGDSHKQGETGGEEEVTLTDTQMPKHKHAVSAIYGLSAEVNTTEKSGYGSRVLQARTIVGNYSDDSNTSQIGSSKPHPNMPPYLTLYYIQKISETPTDYVTEEQAKEIAEEFGGTEYTAGDGISIEDDTIRVDIPVNGVISQEDFDVLPEKQQKNGLWVIPGDGSGTDDGEIYSAEETVIGRWLDGKPLYRMVFPVTTPSTFSTTGSTEEVAHVEIPVDQLVNMYGTVVNKGNDQRIPIPFYNHAESFVYIAYNTVNHSTKPYSLRVNCSSNYTNSSAIIIMEYTKTTDKSMIQVESKAAQLKEHFDISSDKNIFMPITGSIV